MASLFVEDLADSDVAAMDAGSENGGSSSSGCNSNSSNNNNKNKSKTAADENSSSANNSNVANNNSSSSSGSANNNDNNTNNSNSHRSSSGAANNSSSSPSSPSGQANRPAQRREAELVMVTANVGRLAQRRLARQAAHARQWNAPQVMEVTDEAVDVDEEVIPTETQTVPLDVSSDEGEEIVSVNLAPAARQRLSRKREKQLRLRLMYLQRALAYAEGRAAGRNRNGVPGVAGSGRVSQRRRRTAAAAAASSSSNAASGSNQRPPAAPAETDYGAWLDASPATEGAASGSSVGIFGAASGPLTPPSAPGSASSARPASPPASRRAWRSGAARASSSNEAGSDVETMPFTPPAAAPHTLPHPHLFSPALGVGGDLPATPPFVGASPRTPPTPPLQHGRGVPAPRTPPEYPAFGRSRSPVGRLPGRFGGDMAEEMDNRLSQVRRERIEDYMRNNRRDRENAGLAGRLGGAIGSRSRSPPWRGQREAPFPAWQHPPPVFPAPARERTEEDDGVRFYFDVVAAGVQETERCVACRDRFVQGTVRIGFQLDSNGLFGDGPSSVRWAHAPRCTTRLEAAINRGDRVSFCPYIPRQQRLRLLEDLATIQLEQEIERNSRTLGQARTYSETLPWDYHPAIRRGWEEARVMEDCTEITWPHRSSFRPLAEAMRPNVWSRTMSEQAPGPGPAPNRPDRRNPAPQSPPPIPPAPPMPWNLPPRLFPAPPPAPPIPLGWGSQRGVTVAPPVAPPAFLREAPWAAVTQTYRAEEEKAAMVRSLLSHCPPYCCPARSVEVVEDEDEEVCIICHDNISVGQSLRRLPCMHVFHRACIDRWLFTKPTCPLDNQKLEDMVAGRPTRPEEPRPPAPAQPSLLARPSNFYPVPPQVAAAARAIRAVQQNAGDGRVGSFSNTPAFGRGGAPSGASYLL